MHVLCKYYTYYKVAWFCHIFLKQHFPCQSLPSSTIVWWCQSFGSELLICLRIGFWNSMILGSSLWILTCEIVVYIYSGHQFIKPLSRLLATTWFGIFPKLMVVLKSKLHNTYKEDVVCQIFEIHHYIYMLLWLLQQIKVNV